MNGLKFSILGDNHATLSSDTLNFKTFVLPFADRLLKSRGNTPFTVGIYADWGQGKTTVMRMLEDYLKQEKKCPTVWFDPWRYNTREAVWKGLALTMVEQIRKHPSLMAEIRRKRQGLKELAARFLTSRLVGKEWADEIITTLRNEPWSPSLLHDFEEHLATLFEIINPEKENGFDLPLVLFVDDLDRCLPEATLAVLEALKLVLSKPGLISIMGFAENELTQAISAAYAKELDAKGDRYDPDWGCRYIKKIIQMPLPLPVVSDSSFDAYVLDCLKRSQVAPELATELERAQDWCGIIREACGNNLREVKRFVNHFISEMDKAEANASARGTGASFDPPRVAFVLLLSWRFRPFFEHIRRKVNDPDLLIRYQRFFEQKIGERELLDADESFRRDVDLARFIGGCFGPGAGGAPPLVPPFASGQLATYLQFGSRAEVAVAAGAPAQEGAAPEVAPAPEPAIAPRETPFSTEPRSPLERGQPTELRPSRAATPQPSREVADALADARSLLAFGAVRDAAARLERAEQVARHSGDLYGLGLVLGLISQVRHQAGDFQGALSTLDEAIESARRFGDRQGEMNLLLQEAKVVHALKEVERARVLFEEALSLAQSLGDGVTEVSILLDMASVLGTSEGWQALPQLERALEVAKKLAHPPSEMGALVSLGQFWQARAQGDRQQALDRALGYFNEAGRIAASLGDRIEESRILQRRGEVLLEQGSPVNARDCFEKALRLVQGRSGREEAWARIRGAAARLRLAHPAREISEEIQQALTLARSLGDRWLELEQLLYVAAAFEKSERSREAESFYGQALELARELRDEEARKRAEQGRFRNLAA